MKIYSFIIRYILILLAGLGNLYVIYQIFTPLTINATGLILSIFTQTTIEEAIITFKCTAIEIIPACVAGSAYYLLLILNLATPNIKLLQRIKILLFTFTSLFILNILRIVLLTAINHSIFFNAIHLIFWYFISVAFVAGLWILSIKIFKISSIPIYTDIRELCRIIKKK